MYTITVLDDRSMNVSAIKRMVIEEDSINTVRFIVPKTYDEQDLTGARWYVSLIADDEIGDMIELTPHTYSATKLYVDWLLTGAATARSGDLDFALRAEVGIYVYQTYTQTITVDSKLDLTGTEEFTPSVLQQYRNEFEELKEDAETARTGAETAESNAELAEEHAELAETNAVDSAQLSADYAEKTVDVEVAPGKYSAKHWAAKAQENVGQALENAFEVVTIDEQDYLVYTY